MSAVCGILSLSDAPPDKNVLSRMMAALEMHGPDGGRIWLDKRIGLGHQMMHITPQSIDEKLPLHDSEGQLAITMDGRLDNRDDLLAALPGSSELADSALLLRAYQKWGDAFTDRLVGEFAFALWDTRKKRLLCCTDPMSVRPLFYRTVPGEYLAFASEVRALLAMDDHAVPINQRRLAMLGVSSLSVYIEPEATCFEGISRVPAATAMSVDARGIRSREYWAPDPSSRLHFTSDAECREAFQDVFSKAVQARLRSAFPVASFLSGGLDSSAITSTASHLLEQDNRRLTTLSAVAMPSARGRVVDETEFIELFRANSNLELEMVDAADARLFGNASETVSSASLCSYSYQAYLYQALVERAKQKGARIILDGDGGELSASSYSSGYLAELLLSARWGSLSRELRCLDAGGRIRFPAIKRQVLRPLLPYSGLKLLGRHAAGGDLQGYPVLETFVRDTLGTETEQIEDQVHRLFLVQPDHRKNAASAIRHEKMDIRMRSHAGFPSYHEARISYPFLDRRVLEFCLAVDGRFKQQDGVQRRLLRLGTQGKLPEAIRSRTSKAPFSPDYSLRYEAEKASIKNTIEAFSEAGKLAEVVDFERVFRALQQSPRYSQNHPMRVDFPTQFLVPSAIYLCYFLDTFES